MRSWGIGMGVGYSVSICDESRVSSVGAAAARLLPQMPVMAASQTRERSTKYCYPDGSRSWSPSRAACVRRARKGRWGHYVEGGLKLTCRGEAETGRQCFITGFMTSRLGRWHVPCAPVHSTPAARRPVNSTHLRHIREDALQSEPISVRGVGQGLYH